MNEKQILTYKHIVRCRQCYADYKSLPKKKWPAVEAVVRRNHNLFNLI